MAAIRASIQEIGEIVSESYNPKIMVVKAMPVARIRALKVAGMLCNQKMGQWLLGWNGKENRLYDLAGFYTDQLFVQLYGCELQQGQVLHFLFRRLHYAFITTAATFFQIYLTYFGYVHASLFIAIIMMPITFVDRQWATSVTKNPPRYQREVILNHLQWPTTAIVKLRSMSQYITHANSNTPAHTPTEAASPGTERSASPLIEVRRFFFSEEKDRMAAAAAIPTVKPTLQHKILVAVEKCVGFLQFACGFMLFLLPLIFVFQDNGDGGGHKSVSRTNSSSEGDSYTDELKYYARTAASLAAQNFLWVLNGFRIGKEVCNWLSPAIERVLTPQKYAINRQLLDAFTTWLAALPPEEVHVALTLSPQVFTSDAPSLSAFARYDSDMPSSSSKLGRTRTSHRGQAKQDDALQLLRTKGRNTRLHRLARRVHICAVQHGTSTTGMDMDPDVVHDLNSEALLIDTHQSYFAGCIMRMLALAETTSGHKMKRGGARGGARRWAGGDVDAEDSELMVVCDAGGGQKQPPGTTTNAGSFSTMVHRVSPSRSCKEDTNRLYNSRDDDWNSSAGPVGSAESSTIGKARAEAPADESTDSEEGVRGAVTPTTPLVRTPHGSQHQQSTPPPPPLGRNSPITPQHAAPDTVGTSGLLSASSNISVDAPLNFADVTLPHYLNGTEEAPLEAQRGEALQRLVVSGCELADKFRLVTTGPGSNDRILAFVPLRAPPS